MFLVVDTKICLYHFHIPLQHWYINKEGEDFRRILDLDVLTENGSESEYQTGAENCLRAIFSFLY